MYWPAADIVYWSAVDIVYWSAVDIVNWSAADIVYWWDIAFGCSCINTFWFAFYKKTT